MKPLLKQLTETFGPSGYEENVRRLVRAEVKPLADEIKVDALGNLIARKRPSKFTKDTKKIMIAAHMDEIGLMVSHVDENGLAAAEVRSPASGASPLVQVSEPYQEPPAALTCSRSSSSRPTVPSYPRPAERIEASDDQ